MLLVVVKGMGIQYLQARDHNTPNQCKRPTRIIHVVERTDHEVIIPCKGADAVPDHVSPQNGNHSCIQMSTSQTSTSIKPTQVMQVLLARACCASNHSFQMTYGACSKCPCVIVLHLDKNEDLVENCSDIIRLQQQPNCV